VSLTRTRPQLRLRAAVIDALGPAERVGGQTVVVVALPEHIGASNAGQVREELLLVINRGARVLIADMTATISCDHAGADAVIRAWQRASASGTELRLVVTAWTVWQVLDQRGMDRLISVYPSLHAAIAAGPFAVPADGNGAPLPLAAELLEELQDAMVLADGDGIIVATSAHTEDMFGYGPGELPGLSAESLVPAGLQGPDRGHRTGRARALRPRLTGAGAQLTGLRKDGTTLPVRVSLTPVPAPAGPLILAVIRDITRADQIGDIAGLARDAATARHEHLRLMDTVITGLFHTGLSLQAHMDSLPADSGTQRIEEAAEDLDALIRQIRETAFTILSRPSLPALPGDDR
jgi:PAS domain S-box-containing protein